MPRLPRRFYARPTLDVARDLLGKVLVHRTRAGVASGVIVEVEAYIGESDPACHAAPGPTKRNAPMYGPPGHAYVYLNYGIHYLVNVVTEPAGAPAAVLIRSLEPLEGLPLMRRRRARPRTAGGGRRPFDVADERLCSGPGNVTHALGISSAGDRCRPAWRCPLYRGSRISSGWDRVESAHWDHRRYGTALAMLRRWTSLGIGPRASCLESS